jgi:vacuolar-type H+-ATPase catalytic subunit A/Vma1
MSKPFLSKSKYLKGIQCPKLLWYQYNAKDKLPEVDKRTQSIFDQGHEVGELAKKLFPNGIEVEWELSYEEVIKRSQELLKEGKPLFEAGFLFNRTYARVDVLNPVGKQFDIIEVKMSSKVKEINLHDVAFQRYC